jgi:hypothetical protein
VLQRFAKERGITYPLISDPGSIIIKRYGLLNETIAPTNRAYGIPYPWHVHHRSGRTRAVALLRGGVPGAQHGGEHLARTGTSVGSGPVGHAVDAASAGDGRRHRRRGRAGQPVLDRLRGHAGPGMHVYAPGKHTYQVVSVEFDPQPWLTAHPIVPAV